MKNKYAKLVGLSLLTLAASLPIHAEEVNFPAGQKNGSFNCTLSDMSATVNIDTSSLKANGFCSGSPYVTQEGHISGLPAKIVMDSYFEIEKDIHKSGSVNITASSGTITCSTGHGDKASLYGDGKYCLK